MTKKKDWRDVTKGNVAKGERERGKLEDKEEEEDANGEEQ